MENKLINVVWCDDRIDTLYDDNKAKTFKRHNCALYKKAKTAKELMKILNEEKNNIDAVIVDFNVSDTNEHPDKDSASGFRRIHEHLEEYAPIPFYLFSGRDYDFIKDKYAAFEFPMEGDYFFSANENVKSKRHRYFQANELDNLLSMIEEEVAFICTPTYRIRQEYSEAFAAINKFSLEGDVFIKILLSDESIDRYDLADLANPMRMVIEALVTRLDSEGIIPTWRANLLNKIPNLLAGETPESRYYSPQDFFMPKSLVSAFIFFLEFTQDGSHNKDKDYLSLAFRNYLLSSNDVYIVKALAIICLDIIKWAAQFYDTYHSQRPFPFTFKPFNAQISEMTTFKVLDGGFVYDSEGRKYFLPQFKRELFMFEVGTNVEIKSINKAIPQPNGELIFYVDHCLNTDVSCDDE